MTQETNPFMTSGDPGSDDQVIMYYLLEYFPKLLFLHSLLWVGETADGVGHDVIHGVTLQHDINNLIKP